MGANGTTTLRADTILTMADGSRPVRSVSIEGERIARVDDGSAAPEPVAGEVTLDFGNRVLLPGFIDVHAHYEVAARVGYQTVDVRAPGCATVADVLDVLRDGARESDNGWVIGQGNLFLDQKLADKRFPTREELDSVSTDIGVAVRAGGHITMLNSKALELAGIGSPRRHQPVPRRLGRPRGRPCTATRTRRRSPPGRCSGGAPRCASRT